MQFKVYADGLYIDPVIGRREFAAYRGLSPVPWNSTIQEILTSGRFNVSLHYQMLGTPMGSFMRDYWLNDVMPWLDKKTNKSAGMYGREGADETQVELVEGPFLSGQCLMV